MARETWKTQSWWSLPVYTGDVSGVCSALYELGGMVVMHDPSGCNSTYNTHDEIRWIQQESLIFLSGLTQMDAITGNDKKLIGDIVSAAMEFQPKFIAIANSPVPWLIGTDFHAICAQVSAKTGIPSFHVETNAMHDYTRGAGQAFLKLAQMLFNRQAQACGSKTAFPGSALDSSPVSLPKDGARGKIRMNLLGMTPLDFPAPDQVQKLCKALGENGFDVVGAWAMGSTLEDLCRCLEADVNLVVSSTGIDTARWLEENFRIPYVAGVPCGAFAPVVYDALKETARSRESRVPALDILRKGRDDGHTRCIAGEPVTMGSLAADKVLTDGRSCDLIPLTETVLGLVPEGTVRPLGEQQIRDVLGGYDEVIADPMLKPACQSTAIFEEFPHLALSGRLYLDRVKSFL